MRATNRLISAIRDGRILSGTYRRISAVASVVREWRLRGSMIGEDAAGGQAELGVLDIVGGETQVVLPGNLDEGRRADSPLEVAMELRLWQPVVFCVEVLHDVLRRGCGNSTVFRKKDRAGRFRVV